MIGRAYSPEGDKFNVIILAGGMGQRMGIASDYIPKSLTMLGSRRAIDYIIDKYSSIAERIVVGTGWQADLLESYIKGLYEGLPIFFSRENVSEMKNDGFSTIHCLDWVNSRFPTILVYCDLLIVGNNDVVQDSLLVATKDTKGHIGTFRNTIDGKSAKYHESPVIIGSSDQKGMLGYFVFSDTPLLKSLAYGVYRQVKDLVQDIVVKYIRKKPMKIITCKSVFEFGTEEDLKIVRKLWESV